MTKKDIISTDHHLQDLTSLATSATPYIRKLLGKNGLLQVEILQNWQKIVGTEMAQYSLPQKIVFRKNEKSNGCLYISVLSGAFALEINQKSSAIINKINVFFGYPAVSTIKIVQTGSIDVLANTKKNAVNVKKTLVYPQEEIYITELTEGIQSEALRETIERLGRAVFNEHKKQE
ncbi:MAG: DUF721 domain-containing protein [Alphaproteobacteria bacterium]|nr:DUF721 domain-containing protein [Alphaproteobacteria bacterium]